MNRPYEQGSSELAEETAEDKRLQLQALGRTIEHMTRIDTKLGEYIREQRLSSRVSLRQLAAAAGVSNPYLSQVERGLRRPSAEILNRIATGLRISAESLYVRAGILQERSGSPDVLSALGADLTITDRQRKVLLDIYSTFQAENNRDTGQTGGTGRPTLDPQETRDNLGGAGQPPSGTGLCPGRDEH